MGFRKTTRDVEAQGAAKEHTSKARSGSRGPGVRGPGAGLGQRVLSAALLDRWPQVFVY